MNKEEILAEAKKRYSPGTKYKALDELAHCFITGDLQYGESNNIYGVNWGKNNQGYNNDSNVYNNGIWAKIISSPIKCYELW